MNQHPALSSSEAWQSLMLESPDVLRDNQLELSLVAEMEPDKSHKALSSVLDHYVGGAMYPSNISQELFNFIVHLTQPYRIPEMTLRMDNTLSQLRRLDCKGTLLDYGGGGEKDSIIFARAGFDVTFADFLDNTIMTLVRKRFALRNLDIAMMEVRNMGNQRFDCVACMDVIEHVYDLEYVLADLVSRAKPGGCLVLYPSFFNS